MSITHSRVTKTFLSVSLFYTIAMVLRYYMVIEKPSFLVDSNHYVQSLLLGASPLIAGLVLVVFFRRKNDLSLFEFGYVKTFLLFIFPLALFSIVGFFKLGHFDITTTTIIFIAIIYAIFEEYGWRGYLQSELREIKPIYKYFIISILWYFWHFDFGWDQNHLISYMTVLAGSIGIGFVADKSKSLIVAALFHMFYNVLFSNELSYITIVEKSLILILCIIFTIYIMRVHLKKKRLQL